MTSFEYLATLVSVVAGLGVARGLSGLARIIHGRGTVRTSWLHLLWTLNVLIWLVAFWWFTFGLSALETWTFHLLFFVLFYGAAIYLLIALLYPEPLEDGADLSSHFLKYRVPFFATFTALAFVDIADSLIKASLQAGPPPLLPYAVFISLWLLAGTAALITSNLQVHAAVAVGYFLTVSAWVSTALLNVRL